MILSVGWFHLFGAAYSTYDSTIAAYPTERLSSRAILAYAKAAGCEGNQHGTNRCYTGTENTLPPQHMMNTRQPLSTYQASAADEGTPDTCRTMAFKRACRAGKTVAGDCGMDDAELKHWKNNVARRSVLVHMRRILTGEINFKQSTRSS